MSEDAALAQPAPDSAPAPDAVEIPADAIVTIHGSEDADRYAIVRDGVVENVTVWDGKTEWAPPDGTTLVKVSKDSERVAAIGASWDGKAFTVPEPDPAELAKAEAIAVQGKRLAELQARGWADLSAAEREEATGLGFDLSARK